MLYEPEAVGGIGAYAPEGMRPPAHRGFGLRPGGNAERKKKAEGGRQRISILDLGFQISD